MRVFCCFCCFFVLLQQHSVAWVWVEEAGESGSLQAPMEGEEDQQGDGSGAGGAPGRLKVH